VIAVPYAGKWQLLILPVGGLAQRTLHRSFKDAKGIDRFGVGGSVYFPAAILNAMFLERTSLLREGRH
jgi:hypothetical protein